MPVFRLRNRVEILRQMVARVVARSKINKLRRNSVIFHILAAAADSDADIYFQLARLREMFSIDNATGSDLDERAREIQPGTITRRTEIYASTFLIFSRQTNVGTVAIPNGTLVSATDSQGRINFRTTAASFIPDTATTSALVPAIAAIAGVRANVVAGEISQLVSRIPGVTGVTNPSDIANGRDRELDDQFRRRIKDFIASLARGVIAAIEGFARQVRLQNGRAVLFAKVFEPVIPTGVITLYIDDGTGSVETFDGTFVGGIPQEDVLIASAVGGETIILSSQRPLRDDVSMILRVNDIVITRGVDWAVDVTTGTFELLPAGAFPTGLAVGDKVAANYSFYTGLIQETQRVISGDPLNPITYPGVEAGGITTIVKAAIAVFQTLTANVTTLQGFDLALTRTSIEAAILDYVNNLDVGDDVIVSKIIELVMEVPGVSNFHIIGFSGSTTASGIVDQVIAEHQVARIQSSDIHIT